MSRPEALVALALSRVAGIGATLGLSVGFGICAAGLWLLRLTPRASPGGAAAAHQRRRPAPR